MSLTALFASTEEFFSLHNISDDHGWDHAFTVATSAVLAVSALTDEVPRSLIVAAALLHDTDDHKLFKTVAFSNARTLLENAGFSGAEITTTIEMISLVSASANGNTAVSPQWKLIPRDADRIEAIGKIGVDRCYLYTQARGQPVATINTPIVTCVAELAQVNCELRYAEYVRTNGRSISMIDHFYDKLLNIGGLGSGNLELQKIADHRHLYMLEWLFRVNTRRRDLALASDLTQLW